MKNVLFSLMLAALSAQAAAAPQASSKEAASAPAVLSPAKAANAAGASAASAPPAAKPASAPAAPPTVLGVGTAANVPSISATSYVVKDLHSNQILAQKNAGQQIEPASLTKMMTAYLVFQALENGKLKPSQMLTVSDKGYQAEGSRMFLRPGKPASVSDLVKGLAVNSANDAAITLAEAVAGSEESFVGMMNAEAARLGMKNTRFANSTGLYTEGHLSTAGDLAILAGALINDYPKYYPVFSLKSFTYNKIEQPNRNLLLYRDSSVDGLMIGFSNIAGYNLAASSKRNGRRVISILTGAESVESRASESSKLLNWALQTYDTPKLYDAGQAISQVRVYKGNSKAVNVGFIDTSFITIPHGTGKNIKPILETVQPVLAPVQKGKVLGKLKIMQGSKVLVEKEVVALNGVEEAGWFGRTWDSIRLWFRSMIH